MAKGDRFLENLVIEGTLGRGGMGEVYLATDELRQREVALKLIQRKYAELPDFVERFQREMKALRRLSHPNIVRLYNAGRAPPPDGRLYMIMERIEGVTLRRIIDTMRSRGGLDLVSTIHYGLQLVEAVGIAHAKGILHRDIKPENILVGHGGHVWVVDFGLAQEMGAVRYRSPEQIRGHQADERADLYAVGIVLYEMLAARHPYPVADEPDGDHTRILAAHSTAAPQPLLGNAPPCPPSLREIVARCLTKDRDARYRSADDVATDLRAVLQDCAPDDPITLRYVRPATTPASPSPVPDAPARAAEVSSPEAPALTTIPEHPTSPDAGAIPASTGGDPPPQRIHPPPQRIHPPPRRVHPPPRRIAPAPGASVAAAAPAVAAPAPAGAAAAPVVAARAPAVAAAAPAVAAAAPAVRAPAPVVAAPAPAVRAPAPVVAAAAPAVAAPAPVVAAPAPVVAIRPTSLLGRSLLTPILAGFLLAVVFGVAVRTQRTPASPSGEPAATTETATASIAVPPPSVATAEAPMLLAEPPPPSAAPAGSAARTVPTVASMPPATPRSAQTAVPSSTGIAETSPPPAKPDAAAKPAARVPATSAPGGFTIFELPEDKGSKR